VFLVVGLDGFSDQWGVVLDFGITPGILRKGPVGRGTKGTIRLDDLSRLV
jgi:hypothetical protein